MYMSIHAIILAVLLYAIVRAALRGKQPDPMAGRLLHRDPALTALAQPMHEAWVLQRTAIDDAMHPHNLFESPEQMQARSLRARVAAPTLCADVAAWHAEQSRLDAIDSQP
jgi:hypothetical protein